MRTFDEICKSIAYDRRAAWNNIPKQVTVYLAYRNGECQKFKSREGAESFSKLIESYVTNRQEIDEYMRNLYDKDGEVQGIWMRELREEYRCLSDGVFDICYDAAYERSHSYGFDEIANSMRVFAEFAQQVLKNHKNSD